MQDRGKNEDSENAEDFLRNWREPVFFRDWCSEDWSVVMTQQRLYVFFAYAIVKLRYRKKNRPFMGRFTLY